MAMNKPGYEVLAAELEVAYAQAAYGKGNIRHGSHLAFADQPIFTITQLTGQSFLTGQAIKKIQESQRMEAPQSIHELHGAIVYLAALASLLRKELETQLETSRVPE